MSRKGRNLRGNCDASGNRLGARLVLYFTYLQSAGSPGKLGAMSRGVRSWKWWQGGGSPPARPRGLYLPVEAGIVRVWRGRELVRCIRPAYSMLAPRGRTGPGY